MKVSDKSAILPWLAAWRMTSREFTNGARPALAEADAIAETRSYFVRQGCGHRNRNFWPERRSTSDRQFADAIGLAVREINISIQPGSYAHWR